VSAHPYWNGRLGINLLLDSLDDVRSKQQAPVGSLRELIRNGTIEAPCSGESIEGPALKVEVLSLRRDSIPRSLIQKL
jgi:hypothetical protein